MSYDSERQVFAQLIDALGAFLEAQPDEHDPDETGGSIHVHIEDGPDLCFPYVRRGDAERLTELLRTATNSPADNEDAPPAPTPEEEQRRRGLSEHLNELPY
ncbi:hypothetical protein NE857_33840 (plasmid) [Nocardiopsis exhalans]|uniref:Uncharacterized protein n=1 Tax=Nocardiopsis exhalans TaxID=163604 RepID=A0ABY5DH17_9ACTN|nr:hypothetical protein [Nocardiopsis exhalans]USY23614.1 hypothetical protein NE857_33840 [Nocardiopsis exhalans]